MDHEPDVFLVDAHSERGSRDDDIVARFVGNPLLLTLFAFDFRETSVVSCRADFLRSETGGEGVAVGTEGGVDDTRDGVWAFRFGG